MTISRHLHVINITIWCNPRARRKKHPIDACPLLEILNATSSVLSSPAVYRESHSLNDTGYRYIYLRIHWIEIRYSSCRLLEYRTVSGRREVREQDEVSPDDQLPPQSVSCLQGQYHFILKAASLLKSSWWTALYNILFCRLEKETSL